MQFDNIIDKILGSPAKIRVITYLFKHTEPPISERELAKLIEVSHMSVNRTMKELYSLNVVSPKRIGKSNLWVINKKSYAYKTIFHFIKNISKISPPIERLKDIIRKFLPKKLVQKSILFGSVAQQKEEQASDIDLFILVKDEKAKQSLQPHLKSLSEKCQEIFGNFLSPYILTKKEFSKKKNLLLIKEIEKGINLI